MVKSNKLKTPPPPNVWFEVPDNLNSLFDTPTKDPKFVISPGISIEPSKDAVAAVPIVKEAISSIN